MSTDTHQLHRYRPTDQSVCFDAEKILNELLENRFDKCVKVPNKVRRNKTDPNTERARNRTNSADTSVTRSKTMPSNYREPIEKELAENNLNNLLNSITQIEKEQNNAVDNLGSSADTEDNLSLASEKKKKKSFLKRAKERIMFALQREQKQNSGSIEDKNNKQTVNTKRQAPDKKNKKSKRQDRGKDFAAEHGYQGKDESVRTPVPAVKNGRSSVLSSIRRSLRSSKTTKNGNVHKISNGEPIKKENNSKDSFHDSFHGLDANNGNEFSHLTNQISTGEHVGAMENNKPDASNNPLQRSLERYLIDRSHSVTSDATPSLPATSSAPEEVSSMIRIPIPPKSLNIALEDARILTPSNMSSTQSNVLDSPGDDIEFIDLSDSENKEKHGVQGSGNQKCSNIKSVHFNESTDFHLMSCSAEQIPHNFHKKHVEVDRRDASPEKSGSGINKRRAFASTHTAAVVNEPPEVEYDELDGLHGELPEEPQKPSPDREALYSVFAQKLIDIGDSYSASASDQRPTALAKEPKEPLTDLEKEIVEYLKSVGDEASRKSRDDLYQRFQSTMQNSMNGVVSWNHVACLFYATKEAISAVGQGTRAALLIKDFTLQYVSDTLASWIVDQGGFDILLSSEESDFGVD